MGRLFWKFFICIWLVQVLGMFGVGFSFWLRDQAALDARQAHHLSSSPPHPPGAMPPDHRPLPPMGHNGVPMPPPHGTHLLPPIEVVVATLVVGLLCAALLAWYFSKPIRNLRTAFDAAADGKLDTRLGPSIGKHRDELSDLGHDFDRMAERLQALVNSQRHLLHDVSHELRSPLARLQAAIGLVRQRPEKLESTLDRIELESTRMDRLVGELLTLSRLETGVMGEMQEEFNLDELVGEIIDDARFEAELQGKVIEFHGYCEVIVRGRAELLGRAIENVVRNAVKHTPPGSWILITAGCDHDEGHVTLAIRDNGPGIPETDAERIFEPFFRSRNGSSSDGHGLGLAIAQRVMQAHHGHIAARNCTGGGLCVEMTLPVVRKAGTE